MPTSSSCPNLGKKLIFTGLISLATASAIYLYLHHQEKQKQKFKNKNKETIHQSKDLRIQDNISKPSTRPKSTFYTGDSFQPDEFSDKNLKKLTPDQLRLKGNDCIQSRDYLKALKYYSLALNKLERSKSDSDTSGLDSSTSPSRSSGFIQTADSYRSNNRSQLSLENKAKVYQNIAFVNEKLKKYPASLENCAKAIELSKNYEKAWARFSKILKMDFNSSQLSEKFSAFEILIYLMAAVLKSKIKDQDLKLKANEILKDLAQGTSEKIYKNKVVDSLPSFNFIVNHVSLFFEEFSGCDFFKILNDHQGNRLYYTEFFSTLARSCSLPSEKIIFSTLLVLSQNFEQATVTLKSLLKSCSQVENLGQGDTLESLTILEKVYINIQLAIAYSHLGQIETAFSYYKEAEQLAPNGPTIFYQRAQLSLSLNKFEDALADFEKSINSCQLSLSNYSKACARATAYQNYLTLQNSIISENENKIEKSSKKFKNDYQSGNFKNSSEFLGLYAQAEQSLGNFEVALRAYDESFEADKNICTALVHKASLLHSIGKEELAKDCLKKVTINCDSNQADSQNEFAYETLASIYKFEENLPEAIKFYEKAIEFSRSKSEIFDYSEQIFRMKAFLEVKRRFGLELGSNGVVVCK